MTKTVRGLMLALVVGLTMARGQSVTTMHQVIASDPLIARDTVFRNMQAEIETELGKTGKGAQLNLLFNRMSEVQEQVIGFLDTPKVSFKVPGRFLVIEYKGKPDSVLIPQLLDTTKLFNCFRESIQKGLTEALSKVLKRFSSDPGKQAFLKALSEALESSQFTVGVKWSVLSLSDDGKELAGLITDVIMKKIEFELGPVWDQFKSASDTVQLNRLAGTLQERLTAVIMKMREPLLRGYQTAERKLQDLVDRFSEMLLAGNAGFALVEGTGSFAGGLIATYVQPKYKVGFYYTSQFQDKDSVSQRPGNLSLIGAQVEWTTEKSQWDFLASYIFGPMVGGSGEVGLGHSWKPASSVIMGESVFFFFAKDQKWEELSAMVGVSLRGTDQHSPALFVGKRFQKGKNWDLVFQVSFPVVPFLN